MSKVTLRCAIYTRKSSEEGLEQGFNSLDAQREACEAFILSQQHEGWKALPELYDDGGFTGGNMDRPALKQLLADIDQKKVNVVVVYKVDRLTRSLADFAKIVEQFDAKGISFVSVTQQFNTTSSMGRLTLNVLLSFAQFEREVTGERIRDKIAASKQKGLWMGGTPPIGYIGHERTLVIHEAHAKLIRYLYQRYLEVRGVKTLKLELDRAGIVAPERTRLSGKRYGGVPISRGNLYQILTNPIYIGKIPHFERLHEGQHPPIIEMDVWHAVQAKINNQRDDHKASYGTGSDSLLVGILFDSEGIKLCPSHSQKQTKRFRYYVSQKLVNELKEVAPDGIRIPAQELETVVINQLCDWLKNNDGLIHEFNLAPEQIQNLIARANQLANDIEDKVKQHAVFRQIVERVEIGHDYLALTIKASAFLPQSSDLIQVKTNTELKRCGHQMRLIITDQNKRQHLKDQNLINYLSKAYQWLTLITSGKVQSIKEIAEAEKVDTTHVTRTINKAFLAPDIVRAILNGTQPSHLNLKYIKQFRVLPNDWNEQKSLLGFNQ
jgi:DNA invertase Pin-like site-specific DNA recombinase/ribosomal protein S15P/S13E